LRRLIGLNKNSTPQRFLCKFRPRAGILKKKILVKKLVYYYYSFSLKKKLKMLVKYNNKCLNYRTIDTTKNLMNIFSLHLCIFVLRSRLASNISKSKSLITKGNIFVNGKAIFNPGYILKEGDIVQMGYFSTKEFLRRIIHSDKPKRFKKKRFFFKLSTRGILSKRVLSLRLLNFSFKAFYKNYNTYFKHY
jgi:ribosomal protein S4